MTKDSWRSEEDFESIPGPIEFLGATHPDKESDKEDPGVVLGSISPSGDSDEDSEEREQRESEETIKRIREACPWEFD
jgi:hypothetical protein